jgi:hypothetical protein
MIITTSAIATKKLARGDAGKRFVATGRHELRARLGSRSSLRTPIIANGSSGSKNMGLEVIYDSRTTETQRSIR